MLSKVVAAQNFMDRNNITYNKTLSTKVFIFSNSNWPLGIWLAPILGLWYFS